ncbi:MAG: hypothetical protein U1F53_14800 [Burkholderiaceae bacterium]
MNVQSITKIALTGAALASLVATVMAAPATPSGAPAGVRVSKQVAPPQGIGPKKLKATYLAAGNGNGASLPQYAFTTVDSTTVSCSTANCTIGIETMAQMTPLGADWAICLVVDGAYASCQYQGIQGSTTGWAVGNARGMATGLAVGSHTVDTQVYTEASGAMYAYYQSDVRVYK